MLFSDFSKHSYARQEENVSEHLVNWSQQLIDMIESVVFGRDFEMTLQTILEFQHTKVSRLTDQDKAEQLELCSQIVGAFETLSARLGIYLEKAKRGHESWKAPRYIRAERSVLLRKKALVAEGLLTKGNTTLTKEDIRNQYLVDYEKEEFMWQEYLDGIKNAHELMMAVVKDIEKRSISLASLMKYTQ